jgi:enoyl-[acyl-carrier protein] reductase III
MSEPRVSVVLGGTGEIGSAIARRLAAPGARLILGYVENRVRALRFEAELVERGCMVQRLEGNIADPATLRALAGAVRANGNRCDHLVHCVGLTSFKPLTQVRPSQWTLTLEVSARSLLDAVATLLEPLSAARGSVLALSSQGSSRFVPDYGALGPAKAALEATVRQLACELGPRGIRVNALRAGLVEGAVLARFPSAMVEAVTSRTPLGRLGTPDEIAAAAMFLLGQDAAWVVGQVLEVDGGCSLT